MSRISDLCAVVLGFQYSQHKSPQITDNEYKAVAVYRMLKNVSSVTRTLTPGHCPVISTLPVLLSTGMVRRFIKHRLPQRAAYHRDLSWQLRQR